MHADDHDVTNLVNTDPVVPSPTEVIVPPSYKDILLRNSSPLPDTFSSEVLFPSPPSPILLDPSTSQVPSYSSDVKDEPSPQKQTSSAVLKPVQDVPPPQQPTTHALLNGAPAINVVDTPGSDISISVGGSLVLEDSQIDQTPSSTYSVPYPSAEPTTIDDRIIKSPNPPSSDCGPISPEPDIAVPSANPPVRLFLSPSAPTPRLLKSTVSPDVRSSPISVSPNDSPSERRMLFGLSSPSMEVECQRVVPSQDGCKRNLLPARKETKRLPNNDLRHRIIRGAIPGFNDDVSDESIERDLRGLEVTIDNQNQRLVQCNKAVTSVKNVPHDESKSKIVAEPHLPCPEPKPDIIADERHVIMVDEARTMPLLDSRVIEISSSSGNSSPSPSTLIKVVRAEENRQFALKVLRETFPNIKPSSPPNRVSSSAGLDNHPNSHSPLSTTTTAEDRNNNAVAPPPSDY